ncbi:MAG: citramalate synthase [Propionibacteriaceae bacterium]|jgi:2-isopropylmalate synthase|nr:citramalate synthase [Propionibacteriaceae bacterium]
MFPTLPEDFHVFDTTLRDGSQQEGIHLTPHDKLRLARLLDRFGVTHIEGGWPGANPADTAFFAEAARSLELRQSQLVAFGATRRVGLTAQDDPLTQALAEAGTEFCCIVAKSHVRHVLDALKTTLAENLAMVSQTVEHLRGLGKRVFVDCEHFFDGYLADPGYALAVIEAASGAGAEVAVLCDTNGGMVPRQIAQVVEQVLPHAPKLGIHCHNDTGCAVANTLSGVDAGVSHVQGTVNGYGERTGNADLTTVVANLQLKYGWDLVTPEALRDLTHLSQAVAEITGQHSFARQPYVGASSFAHKAGLHASAIKVDADLYQQIDPELVGNGMRMLISDMSGRANVQIKAEQLGHDLSDPELAGRVAEEVKRRAAAGYSYEAADASFDLLLRALTGQAPDHFQVATWRAETDQNESSQAVVRVSCGAEKARLCVGEGNGPVNALDQALRRGLTPHYPVVAEFELIDYRVRLLDDGHGTDAITRVLIDTEHAGRSWTTVGVGENIIEASWEALVDAIDYGLLVVEGKA